jgi:hypothetical protein
VIDRSGCGLNTDASEHVTVTATATGIKRWLGCAGVACFQVVTSGCPAC